MPRVSVSSVLKLVSLVAIVLCPAVPLLVVSIPWLCLAVCFTPEPNRLSDEEAVKPMAYSLSGGLATLAIWMLWVALSQGLSTWFVFLITWPMGLGMVTVKFLLVDSNPVKAFYKMLGILGYKELQMMDAGLRGITGVLMSDPRRSFRGDAIVSPEVKAGLAGAAIFSLMGLALAMACGALTSWFSQDHFEVLCERFANGTEPVDPAQCVLHNARYDIYKAIPAIGGTAVTMYGILQFFTMKIMDEVIEPFLQTMMMGGGMGGLRDPLLSDSECNQQ